MLFADEILTSIPSELMSFTNLLVSSSFIVCRARYGYGILCFFTVF